MSVGGDTFINAMLETAGFENIFQTDKRYPVTEIPRLKELSCELILLATEPYPFKQKHITEVRDFLQQNAMPSMKILLVDGEMFSWYGSRLIKAPGYFKNVQEKLQAGDC
jgi:ABC-type Fe3+-hydroxamate transport system substrate-binding protein